MDKGETSVATKPQEVTKDEANVDIGDVPDHMDGKLTEQDKIDIAKRLKELNIKWEDIFPPEILNWDKELPEDRKVMEYEFKLIKSEPIDTAPNHFAEPIRKVTKQFMEEHLPKKYHPRAKAAVEYLFRVCPLNKENKDRYESMAVFEVWHSYFRDYLLDTNTVEECKRWVELFRDIEYNELLWDQERKDTPMENCFDVVWKRFVKAATLDQRKTLAKLCETAVDGIQKWIDDPEAAAYQQEDPYIEQRWQILNFDIQFIVIDICMGQFWEQEMFDSGRHKPLRRRGERFMSWLHDMYFFEQDFGRKRGKMNIMGMLRESRDFISAPMDIKGVVEIMQERLDYMEWELDEQLKTYFSQPEYLDYSACVRRFVVESVVYYKQINKVDLYD